MANKELKNNKEKKNQFKSLKAELKKVIWPTPKQLLNNTMAVIVIVIILSAIVFVLDVAFESANKHGIDKIKESIVTTNTVENTTQSETENTTSNAEATTENNEVVENTTEQTENNEVVENTENQVNNAE